MTFLQTGIKDRKKELNNMLGLIYTIGKDLIKYISYKEEDKLVDSDWLKKSGFGEEQRQIGNDLR